MTKIFDQVDFDYQGRQYSLRRIQLKPKKSQGIRVYSNQGTLVKQRGQTKPFLREINDSRHLGVNLKKENGETKTVNELGTEIIRMLKSV
jgi:hypothetical protein